MKKTTPKRVSYTPSKTIYHILTDVFAEIERLADDLDCVAAEMYRMEKHQTELRETSVALEQVEPIKLPESLNPEVQKFINNPSCSCNVPLYKKIIKEAKDQVLEYFPGKTVMSQEEEAEQLAKNNWRVVSCSIGDLEKEMKKLVFQCIK